MSVCVQVPVSWSGSRPTSTMWSRGIFQLSETRSLGKNCSFWSLFFPNTVNTLSQCQFPVITSTVIMVNTPAGMCMIKVVWRPPMTSPFLYLPLSSLSCRLSIHRTSSSPTASGIRQSVRSVSKGSSSVVTVVPFFRIEMSSKASPEAACQLDSRYWKITTSDGNVEEVQGPGVVGMLNYHMAYDNLVTLRLAVFPGWLCWCLQESSRSWDLGKSMSTQAAPPSPPRQSTWRVTIPFTDWVMSNHPFLLRGARVFTCVHQSGTQQTWTWFLSFSE